MEMGGKIKVVTVCPGPVQSEITINAFSHEVGKSYGKEAEDAKDRMTAQRCAELYAAAMWAKLPESWIAPQPVLMYVYIRQFLPWLFFLIGPQAGARRVEAFKTGKVGYGSLRFYEVLTSSQKKD